MYLSTKILDGFSCCFRQWKATHSHCSKLHGYAIKFKVTFESENLDDKNWVVDFGFLKSTTFKFDGLFLKDWFNYMFDHTVVISSNDPFIRNFADLEKSGLLDLRIIENVGCEAFAELVFVVLELMLKHEKMDGRVKLRSVECIEHEKNSAIYEKRY